MYNHQEFKTCKPFLCVEKGRGWQQSWQQKDKWGVRPWAAQLDGMIESHWGDWKMSRKGDCQWLSHDDEIIFNRVVKVLIAFISYVCSRGFSPGLECVNQFSDHIAFRCARKSHEKSTNISHTSIRWYVWRFFKAIFEMNIYNQSRVFFMKN